MDEAAALSASQFGLTDTQAKEMIRRGEDSDRRVWREADSQEAKRLQEAMQQGQGILQRMGRSRGKAMLEAGVKPEEIPSSAWEEPAY